MKKSALVLSLILMMTMFTFVGCGGNNTDNSGTTENGTIVEEPTDNIVDDAEKGVEDLGNDVKDGAEDIVDDTEDILDGNDADNNNDNNKDMTENKNNNN